MNVHELLDHNAVFIPLEVSDKTEIIKAMAEGLATAGVVTDVNAYVQAVLTREESGSTGVGFGVAIPHGKSAGVAKAGIAYAKLAQPSDWQSLDGAPVNIVFMIAVPEENVGNEHLQILVSLSRKLIHEDFRNSLLAAENIEQVHEILKTL